MCCNVYFLDRSETQKNHRRTSSAVSREVKCNSLSSGAYLHQKAQLKAESRRSTRPGIAASLPLWYGASHSSLSNNSGRLSRYRELLLEKRTAWAMKWFYKTVRKDTTGKLAMQMWHQMRYRRKHNSKHITKATNIFGRISMHLRSESQNGNLEGMWEMDTIIGKDGKGANLSHKERSTPLLLMTKFKKGKNAKGGPKKRYVCSCPSMGKCSKIIQSSIIKWFRLLLYAVWRLPDSKGRIEGEGDGEEKYSSRA